MSDQLVLKFDHNVIEHLGLKLYQNKPTNVLAELVSNGWDADAGNVWIDLKYEEKDADDRWIAIADDGFGMSYDTLRDNYLIIGKHKRSTSNLTERSPKERQLMGRKGIGKLAPFGIARLIDVVTISEDTGKLVWLRMDLEKILEQSSQNGNVYEPEILADNIDKEEIDSSLDPTGAVEDFVKKISDGTGSGTLVLMRRLTLSRVRTGNAIMESMGRRMTVVLLRDDFNVHVNGTKIEEQHSLPEFEFRIPTEGMTEVTVDGKPTKFWVGFVEHAGWPQDQAGVGIYAHGKIAQDRPFTFGVKGLEITTRYMYAVVEADWVDEFPEDMVSTDRTSINWEHPVMKALYDWGNESIKNWVKSYREWAEIENRTKIQARITKRAKERSIPKLSEPEQVQIVELLAGVSSKMGKNPVARNRVEKAVAQAWTREPMRKLIKGLWDELPKASEQESESLADIINKLSEHSVPESLSLAVSFAQRAYALTMLNRLIKHGIETDLQKLIEKFPWIIEPTMECLTANQELRTTIQVAEEREELGTNFPPVSPELGVKDNKKPDFVFLSNTPKTEIVVIELKNPQNELTIPNREQLRGYLTYFEQRFPPETKLRGILVGNNPSGMNPNDPRVIIKTWTTVFHESQIGHVELLSSMLSGSRPGADDSRVKDVEIFGGPQTWELLNNIAEKDGYLKELIEEFEKIDPLKPT